KLHLRSSFPCWEGEAKRYGGSLQVWEALMGRQFSTHRGLTRVVFGAGAEERVAAEIEALGCARVAVLCTLGRREAAAALVAKLGDRSAGVLPFAREHVPASSVADARHEVEKSRADAVLAFGGGSAIGLAKGLALTTAVKIVAVPTTYSGS